MVIEIRSSRSHPTFSMRREKNRCLQAGVQRRASALGNVGEYPIDMHRFEVVKAWHYSLAIWGNASQRGSRAMMQNRKGRPTRYPETTLGVVSYSELAPLLEVPRGLASGKIQVPLQFRKTERPLNSSLRQHCLEFLPGNPCHLHGFSKGKRSPRVKGDRKFLAQLPRDFLAWQPHCTHDMFGNFNNQGHGLNLNSIPIRKDENVK